MAAVNVGRAHVEWPGGSKDVEVRREPDPMWLGGRTVIDLAGVDLRSGEPLTITWTETLDAD